MSGVCGCGRRRRAEVTCSAFGSCTSMDPSAATRSELTSDRKLGGLMSGELGGLTGGVLRGGAVAAALSRGALFIISRGTRRMRPRRRACRPAQTAASVLLARGGECGRARAGGSKIRSLIYLLSGQEMIDIVAYD